MSQILTPSARRQLLRILAERLIADAELIDEICLENERSLKHMK